MSIANVKQLFTHYVKGLSPQECDRVFLKAGHGIPGDRAFALMHGQPEEQTEAVPWKRKQHFVMQNDWPGLAGLACHYDSQTATLAVQRAGVELLVAQTNTPAGRDRISAFFTGYLAALEPVPTARHPEHGPLQLVGNSNGTTRYPDREPVHLSLVSQASLDHLTQVAGQPIEVRRFRPNVLLEGVAAWAEMDWVGQELQLGTARIVVTAPINRCLNIDVNPQTGEPDIPLFSLLQEKLGHPQTGVLAKIITSGSVSVGDHLSGWA